MYSTNWCSQCAKTYILLQLVLTVTVPILFEHVHISLLSHNKKPTMSHFRRQQPAFFPSGVYLHSRHAQTFPEQFATRKCVPTSAHAQVTYSTKFCKDQLLPSSKLHPSPSVPCMSFPQFESSLRYTASEQARIPWSAEMRSCSCQWRLRL